MQRMFLKTLGWNCVLENLEESTNHIKTRLDMDIIKEIRENPDYYFEDECQIGNLDEYKLVGKNKTSFIVGSGKIRIDWMSTE